MTRLAILHGNTAKTSEQETSVGLMQLKQYFRDIAKNLAELGENSFEVVQIIQKDITEASEAIQNAVQEIPQVNGDHLVLYYYFGHGVERDGNLYFVGPRSKTSTVGTMLSFGRVNEILTGFNVRNMLYVLDCCESGAAVSRVRTPSDGGMRRFSLAASTVPLQVANLNPGEYPFGAFSLYFFGGLKDINATEAGSRSVTVASLFTYCQQMLEQKGFTQTPYLIDGGLNTMVLSEAEPERTVSPEYNDRISPKSFYSKMYWIVTAVSDLSSTSVDMLYNRVVTEEPIEMMTPQKIGDVTVYKPVHQNTFAGYIVKIKELGALSCGSDGIHLTSKGTDLVAFNSADYNTILLELIEENLQLHGTSLDDIDHAIRYTLRTRQVPDSRRIFLDLRRSSKLSMSQHWFSTLLDLSAFAGYFKYSSGRTFFVY